LVGVAMVMINFHVELCIESFAFHPGTSLGNRRLSTNWYQDETCRKCCRQDIFQVADVSCSVLKFREVWLWRNFGGTYGDLWRNLRRTSPSWLCSLSLLDPSTQRQRVGKLTIDMTFLVP
jgi:hypothetical protein